MTDEQKSIVVDVQMPRGKKKFALQFDRISRDCTEACHSSALKQGITKGDEVLYTVNSGDQFSYLKKTGKTFKLDELPQPAPAPIIDAEKEQARQQPPANESKRINHEVHRSEIIMWEALLNTATSIAQMSGRFIEYDEDKKEGELTEIEKEVQTIATNLHAFIMEKVGEGK